MDDIRTEIARARAFISDEIQMHKDFGDVTDHGDRKRMVELMRIDFLLAHFDERVQNANAVN